uniref:Reverse transcriptase domain-containing protein n=1 Tax=Panagrolaimus davidi TaxID=227884 RepID=A0A914QJ31_9BILA
MHAAKYPACIPALLYANCETSIRLPSGPSEAIKIESGVRQGCPLSPILFNIAMEPLIRGIENLKSGYTIHGSQHSSKTFADDLCLIGRNQLHAQMQLNFASNIANWLGIQFNPKKCSTLHIKSNKVVKTQLRIQGQPLEIMEKETPYTYLGVPTGFKTFNSATETIEQLKKEVKAVDNSLLFPWQKFDAVNTFIIPKLSFHLKLSHAFRLLTSTDQRTQKLAYDSMKEVVQQRSKNDPSMEEISEYYNGSKSSVPPEHVKNDVTSCWIQLRAAIRRLSAKMKIFFQPDRNKKKFHLIINNVAATRFNVEAQLRDATRNYFKQRLIAKPGQGRVYNVTAKNPVSNHFYRNVNLTRLNEWNFIHRARLDLVPLNGGTKKWFTKDQSCRKCKYKCESLFHVLNCCDPNYPTMTRRHDAVVHRLVDGFKKRKRKSQEILLDQIIPETSSTLQPDITILDKKKKEAIIIDVTIPYENLPKSFVTARDRKYEKYTEIKKELQNLGYNVFLDAFIVGSLGGYDPENYKCLKSLDIPKNYSILMKKLMVTDVVRWSREIYMNHVCQKRKNAALQ